MKTRPLQIRDILPAAQLLSDKFNHSARDIRRDMFDTFLHDDPDSIFIVAVNDSKITGAVKCTRTDAAHFTLTFLAVAPALRGAGIGAQLVKAAEENALARSTGASVTMTLTDATKRHGKKSHFYEALGYEKIAAGTRGMPVMSKKITRADVENSSTPGRKAPPPTPPKKPSAP
jgi:GNAT superfamily N-acetyltransferase